ncbi:uncharacterized protein LOC130536602 [Takifugu flavidus]|uniref:uncharacterized protein LOC130536602 n=1 Tax=Takifugu flavidus TaxID=433684 RepID=UPI0025445D66|nr:uncharacterized protein LOC130536602 [Takifugu flavidus]
MVPETRDEIINNLIETVWNNVQDEEFYIRRDVFKNLKKTIRKSLYQNDKIPQDLLLAKDKNNTHLPYPLLPPVSHTQTSGQNHPYSDADFDHLKSSNIWRVKGRFERHFVQPLPYPLAVICSTPPFLPPTPRIASRTTCIQTLILTTWRHLILWRYSQLRGAPKGSLLGKFRRWLTHIKKKHPQETSAISDSVEVILNSLTFQFMDNRYQNIESTDSFLMFKDFRDDKVLVFSQELSDLINRHALPEPLPRSVLRYSFEQSSFAGQNHLFSEADLNHLRSSNSMEMFPTEELQKEVFWGNSEDGR